MMTGHSGWPMSNFLIANGNPFFGGTYYNPKQFMNLLSRVSTAWKNQEPDLRMQTFQMHMSIEKK